MQKNYKRLGEYIQQVDERNFNLEDLPLNPNLLQLELQELDLQKKIK